MTVKASKRFFRDLSRLHAIQVLDDAEFVFDLAYSASSPEDILGFKWLMGHDGFGRISIGSYRIGVEVRAETIIFKCVMHRTVMYKFFP